MKHKLWYIVLAFIFFFLIEITVGFSFKKEDSPLSKEEIVPISFRISNNLSTDENTLVVDEYMTEFMKQHDIRGTSVAITKDERLVYAKGFGYANEETGELTEPKHLFRVASVSKLITAVAVMKLAEDGKLSVTDKVFGPDGILNDSAYLNIVDNRAENISIQQLLTHTSGLPGKKNDPLFSPLKIANKLKVKAPINRQQLIRYVLQHKLENSPGRKYAYSNTGYVILGEVIEHVSGQLYEDYVNFNILLPLGINDMHIGKNFYEQKFHNEVKYYDEAATYQCMAFDGSGKVVPLQYGGNNIELLGPAGGWVASAPELIRFITAVDGFNGLNDILSQHSIEYMIEAQKKYKSTIGWRGSDGYGTWWRTGTLSGSYALVMRQKNGINWVVLSNTSTKKHSRIHHYLSKTMFEILTKVNKWPKHDLFTYYEMNKQEPLVLKP